MRNNDKKEQPMPTICKHEGCSKSASYAIKGLCVYKSNTSNVHTHVLCRVCYYIQYIITYFKKLSKAELYRLLRCSNTLHLHDTLLGCDKFTLIPVCVYQNIGSVGTQSRAFITR